MRIVKHRTTPPPTTHDEVLVSSDGALAAYATAVPNGTSPFAHSHAAPRPSRTSTTRSASSVVAASGGAPAAPGPASAPVSERPTPPPPAMTREQVRSAAARLGHLPPQSLDEATYPAHWLPDLDHAAGGTGGVR